MVPEPSEGSAVVTNPVYARLFVELGVGSIVVGVVLVALIPFLRRLISDAVDVTPQDDAPTGDAAAA